MYKYMYIAAYRIFIRELLGSIYSVVACRLEGTVCEFARHVNPGTRGHYILQCNSYFKDGMFYMHACYLCSLQQHCTG